MTKKSILGYNTNDLITLVGELGQPKYRAAQIYHWLYTTGIKDFAQCSNLKKDLRADLEEKFSLTRAEITKHQISNDGTEKFLLQFNDGNSCEVVFIPEEKRGTLCISSQVGCTLNCSFCHTGTQKLVRNLTAGEILAQVMLVRDKLDDWCIGAGRKITNIVLMGMGEPLLNYDATIKAINIMIDEKGMNYSRRRVTLSTSGVVPALNMAAGETKCALAISLHATNDDLRNILVPINKKYPLKQLIASARNYLNTNNSDHITWEYVMLDGVNDTELDARQLVKLIKGIPSKVNLLPFNKWEGSNYRTSSNAAIDSFARIVKKAGYICTVRRARGQDIMAACGQLKTADLRINNK